MSHLHHLHHYHLPRMRELGRVYWCHSFGALAISLAAIFVPIHLLNSGLSIDQVFLFSFAQYGLSALLMVPVTMLISRISPHHMMLIGSMLMAIFFTTLSFVHFNLMGLGILALIWAIQHCSYWTSFHYVFSEARAHKNSNRQVAGLDALVIVATTIAPAAGGIIATTLGIGYTYALSIMLLLVAIAPMIKGNLGPPSVRLKLRLTDFREIKRDLFANVSSSTVFVAEGLMWPIFVFYIVSTYAGVGILSSVIAIASFSVTIYVGKKAGQIGEKPYIRRGVVAYSLTSLARAAVQNAGHVFGLNLLAGIGRSLYHAPYLNRYYSNSDKKERLGYITAMEIAHQLGASLMVIILIILSIAIGAKAALAVLLASVAITILGVRAIR